MTAGDVVVFRTPAARLLDRRGPRLGRLVGPCDGENIAIKPAMGARGWSPRALLVPKACIAREATARERTLGFPVDPVPGAAS